MTEAGEIAPDRRPAAIVLAAGESRRMGGVPKAAIRIGGVPAVRRIVDRCVRLGVAPVHVVTGAHTAAVRESLGDSSAVVVENPRWSEGRTGSIHTGIGSLEHPTTVLLWPVDHPFVEAKTVEALLRHARSDAMALWVIPTFEGRGGHPVVLQPETFGAVLALRPDRPLRDLVETFGPQVARVPVDDPGTLENVDTPAEYAAALARIRAGGGEREWTGD